MKTCNPDNIMLSMVGDIESPSDIQAAITIAAKPAKVIADAARTTAKARAAYGTVIGWASAVAMLAAHEEHREACERTIAAVLEELKGKSNNSARTGIRAALNRALATYRLELVPRGGGRIRRKINQTKPAPANPENMPGADIPEALSGEVEPTSRDKPIESDAPTDPQHGAADTLVILRDRVMVALDDYAKAAGIDAALELLTELVAAMETHKAQDATTGKAGSKGRKGKRA